ncbi:MAG: NAD-dependent epimerase/dehydratase family protein [Desulfobacula sp.]|nr:NAD-dependent epimerase/dehydratase family protein [Desulfobacula sp.]
MGLNWLMTGGCGFIGRNHVKNLINEGDHYIRIVDNLSVGTKDDLSQVCQFKEANASALLIESSAVDLVEADILDADLSMKVAKNMDIIVHLAANTGVGPSVENPKKDCETNIIGMLNYLEASRYNKIKRFIFASSGAPAGEVIPPIHEELPPHPVSPYGASKLAGEGYCSAYFRTFGVETVALRFGNVYGPFSSKKDSVVAKFIKKALNNKALKIYGDGTQTRDFIYIEDLVQALRLAAEKEHIGGEIFQIATNRETTVNELTDIIVSVLHDEGLKNIEIENKSKRLGDVLRNFSDTTKAKKMLKWQANTGLYDGIQKTISWFLNADIKDN